MSDKPNIVLVHGAWADGSSWSGVIESLQADGYTSPPRSSRRRRSRPTSRGCGRSSAVTAGRPSSPVIPTAGRS